MSPKTLSGSLKLIEDLSTRAVKHIQSIKVPSVEVDLLLKPLRSIKYPRNSRGTSAAVYGAAAVVTFIWLTDWKAVCRYIPFYGSKYERSRQYADEPVR